jgi:hypothetical protein
VESLAQIASRDRVESKDAKKKATKDKAKARKDHKKRVDQPTTVWGNPSIIRPNKVKPKKAPSAKSVARRARRAAEKKAASLPSLGDRFGKELEATYTVNGEALNKEEWNLHNIQEAKLSAARTHAMHLAMKTNCDCPSIEAAQMEAPVEVRKNHAFPLTTAEKPGMVMRGEPSAMYGADGKALEEDPMARKIDIRDKNDSKLEANERTVENKQDSKGRITTVMLEMDKEIQLEAQSTSPKGFRTHERTRREKRGKKPYRLQRKTEPQAQGNNSGIAWVRTDKYKNKDRETVNPNKGKQIQLEAEPTICSSLAVFNEILNKTEYDDKVVARQGKAKRSKRNSITNSTVDTAAQQINDTRGI